VSKTRKIYADNLRLHILPVLGHHELAELTPSMLRAWQADLAHEAGRPGQGALGLVGVVQRAEVVVIDRGRS
jgi:hypothetical protein